jgi:hypothetical protein
MPVLTPERTKTIRKEHVYSIVDIDEDEGHGDD